MKYSQPKEPVSIYHRLGYYLLCLSAFLIPIKLAACLGPLILLIILWLFSTKASLLSALKRPGSSLMVPLYFLIITSAYTSLFGLDPLRSLRSIISLTFFSLTPLAIADVMQARRILTPLIALITGQILAATHSIIEGAFPWLLPEIFLGKVTESGQLAMSLVLACGLIFYLKSIQPTRDQVTSEQNKCSLLGILLFLILGAIAFSQYIDLAAWQIAALASSSVLIVATLYNSVVKSSLSPFTLDKLHAFVLTSAVPILSVALIVNLKRGPWAGVLVATALMLATFARRWLAPLLLLIFGLFIFITPVRERILQSYDHFSISGGRETIWNIGIELSTSYPLGIGYKNSPVLRQFAPEIPPELRHFHNNILNVLVESGWLGLCVYIWWIFTLLKAAWGSDNCRDNKVNIVSRVLGCALISWQVAGLVEYNFGDSEVLMVVFLIIGTLITISRQAEASCNSAIREKTFESPKNFESATSAPVN